VAILFIKKDVPASATSPMELAGYTSETVYIAGRPEAWNNAEAIFTDVITAGSISVQIKKNGVLLATISLGIGTLRANLTGLAAFLAEGDRISVDAVSSALAPTTGDLLLILT